MSAVVGGSEEIQAVVNGLLRAPPTVVQGPRALTALRAEVDALHLPAADGHDESWHVFSRAELLALRAAVATRRPLLIRGRPGACKTQLARALAVALGWGWAAQQVDERTEPRDLLYRIDLVRRLAEAHEPSGVGGPSTSERMALERFVEWGALGAALRAAHEPAAASVQPSPLFSSSAGPDPKAPWVVLIDEIDKGERGVATALLDVLSTWGFSGPAGSRVCAADRARRPVVLITTNEERELPDALLRRCLVLHVELPDERPGGGIDPAKGPELARYLLSRAWCRFVDGEGNGRVDREGKGGVVDLAVMARAAEQLAKDRREARGYRSGLAEYGDLLSAVREVTTSKTSALAHVELLAPYYLNKDRR